MRHFLCIGNGCDGIDDSWVENKCGTFFNDSILNITSLLYIGDVYNVRCIHYFWFHTMLFWHEWVKFSHGVFPSSNLSWYYLSSLSILGTWHVSYVDAAVEWIYPSVGSCLTSSSEDEQDSVRLRKVPKGFPIFIQCRLVRKRETSSLNIVVLSGNSWVRGEIVKEHLWRVL